MSSPRVRSTFPVGAALLLLYACGETLTVDDPTDGGAADGSLPEVSVGDAGDPAVACPSEAGPKMVPVDLFCIDSTEVTNAQYGAFVDAMDGGAVDDAGRSLLPEAGCGYTETFRPAGPWPLDPAVKNLPVAEVDWCDAYAFCRWAGKRLCGKISGGPSSASLADSGQDQWFVACSGGGTRQWPYGTTYSNAACNTERPQTGPLVPVGSKPGCEGSAPGLFDMSGNASEWVDICEPGGMGETEDPCALRGGDFHVDPARTACGYLSLGRRAGKGYGASFRCCGVRAD